MGAFRRPLVLVVLLGLLAALLPAIAVHAASEAAASRPGGAAVPRVVTLVTGDRVTLQSDENVVIERGPGRAHISFVTKKVDGHVLVIPSDAFALLSAKRLDRRLFDVTTLVEHRYDDRRRAELPLIVTSAGKGTRAHPDVRGASVRMERALPVVGGAAVAVARRDRTGAGRFWRELTGGRAAPRSMQRGVARVWLDGLRQPTLDTSTTQIGVPAARAAGLDGAGATVAVIDTGIDVTHPDLADRVTAQQNFTDDGTSRDLVGHGTHVASTIAGTGAASAGRYAGVAPAARLLDGKVCVEYGCAESWILAGMSWAAAEQQADVINMSLGGYDSPGIDPLEEAVNTLTAQHGSLFVISAGNDGPSAKTLGSPGTADAALTVGAVDKNDELAEFSSRGPRVGDGGLKPDITAPGVAITAARGADAVFGEPSAAYAAISGTSMAAPHVAGAAALLAQQHPTWSAERLKSTLMGSAKPQANLTVYEQGAGRLDVARAVTQTVSASPASVSFGTQQWPHDDDVPVTKTVTYSNSGTTDVTLDVTATASYASGGAAPAGLLTVTPSAVTVPAGGAASVDVKVDSSVSGPDGLIGGVITATGGAVATRTPVGVDKEVESYQLTVQHINRAGAPEPGAFTTLTGWGNGEFLFDFLFDIGPDGSVSRRLPKADYTIDSVTFEPIGDTYSGSSLLVPAVELDRNRTIVLDARKAKPVNVSVERATAAPVWQSALFVVARAGGSYGSGLLLSGHDAMYTGQLTPPNAATSVRGSIRVDFADPGADGSFAESPVTYALSWMRPELPTGLREAVRDRDLAVVRARYERHATGATGATPSFVRLPGEDVGMQTVSATEFRLPTSRTEYYSVQDGQQWQRNLLELAPVFPELPVNLPISFAEQAWTTYQAGRVAVERWNRGPFGPAWSANADFGLGVARRGDSLEVGFPLYGDSAGRAGFPVSYVTSGDTTLFRDGTKVGSSAYAGYGRFALDPQPATYRLTTSGDRGEPFGLSTRVSMSWTFLSSAFDDPQPQPLPLSVVRFTPELDNNHSAPSGRTFSVPGSVQRQPGSPSAAVQTLRVEASYDVGETWQEARVTTRGGASSAELRHPNKRGFVSLRATAVERDGNTVEQTIIRAYRIS